MLLTAKLRVDEDQQDLANLMISDPTGEGKNYIEYKRLNFFIGKNNSGKSQFLRLLLKNFDFYKSLFFDEVSYSNFKSGSYFQDFERVWNAGILRAKNTTLGFLKDIEDNPCLLFEMQEHSPAIKEYLTEILAENSGYDFLIKFFDQTKSIKSFINDQSETDSFYVPILRGLRSVNVVADVLQPYQKRTSEDYFKDKSGRYNFEGKYLLTGERVYSLLTEYLLDEPEQRYQIKSYESLLSQYFFDGQQISLIPKHNSDVVHIKIGEDKQFPIYQLGDGLQQAIILTYQCYLQQDSVCAFFIEEPELHMHAGMLRQLMNFYLNETKHYYFFTTHSNHLLDMVDESDEVVIQKFTKKKKEDGSAYFEIKRCDKDRELLAALGVRPSSVYLANCTIWVEGITDRLYLTKYMQKYLHDLQTTDHEKFIKYRRFMPNFHYTFVEYQGSNLTHWNFDEEDQDFLETNGLHAPSLCADMLLIADGDIQGKGSRVEDLKRSLDKDQFILLTCKETENTLPSKLLFELAIEKFPRMKGETKKGFDESELQKKMDSGAIDIFEKSKKGVGLILDNIIRTDPPIKVNNKLKRAFADESGTVKEKLKFCRSMLAKMDDLDAWELTETATSICEQIFEFIEKRNQEIIGATSYAS
jgi:AAA15 family ATPase/GTPase